MNCREVCQGRGRAKLVFTCTYVALQRRRGSVLQNVAVRYTSERQGLLDYWTCCLLCRCCGARYWQTGYE